MIADRIRGRGQYLENALYLKSPWIRKLINKKNKRLLGSNFSLYKEDLLAVNGLMKGTCYLMLGKIQTWNTGSGFRDANSNI